MSEIKNGGLYQYGAEPFEQQQFGAAGVERVNSLLPPPVTAKPNTEWSHSRRSVLCGVSVHLAAMEGHCECVRYLAEQLLQEKHHQMSLCSSDATHPALEVGNNLGQTPRALADRFYKYDTVKTIDHLLSQFRAPAKTTDGIYTTRFVICHSINPFTADPVKVLYFAIHV